LWEPLLGGILESSIAGAVTFFDDPDVILSNKTKYPNGFATPGAITSITRGTSGNPYFYQPAKMFGVYFQDDWKIKRNLSVNLGLRWDKDYNLNAGSEQVNARAYQYLKAISSPYAGGLPHDDNKDFSPRIGFAYDLTGAGKHVLRGGYGFYFGNVFQNIPLFMEQMSNATVFQSVLSLTSPGDTVPGTGLTLGQWRYGVSPLPTIPPPSSQLAQGSVGRLMDPDYRNPVTEEFNLGYSWALNQNSVLEAEYTHVLGLHENKTINIDQRVPVGGACCTAPLNGLLEPVSGKPQFASVRNEESIGRSHYDGMNISFRQRMTHHFSVNANYTLAWAYSYDGGGGSFRNYPRVPNNPFASYEWGPSPNDERHHVTLSGIVDLTKGFQLSPIMQFGSARPYNPTNSSNTLNTGGGSFNAVVVPTSDPTNYLAFSGNNAGAQNCFYGLNGVTQACTIAKYDPLRGDPFFELDLRLAKNIKIRERMNLQLVAQAFNLTNRANYGNDFNNSIANTATFGHPAGFINPASTIVPLAVWGEFGVRFTF